MSEKQIVQYVNPIDLSLILYDGVSFNHTEHRKNINTVSRVLYENVIIYSFKIPASKTNDDLNSLVEIKMYEEAGLDVNKNYKITYIVKNLDFDETNLIEAFAIERDLLKENFKDCIDKVKNIDFLALPFFAFKTFYTNKILVGKNDIFVYLSEYESFMSFYKDGSYISTKSQININEILEKLKAEGIELSIDRFYDVLLNKGLDQDRYTSEETELFNFVESTFSQMLTKIQNVAMHNRSVFDFDTIDRLFFSTKRGRVKGLKDFISKFGLTDTEVHDFNLFKEKQESDFLDKIVASYGHDMLVSHSNEQNVTVFQREPAFITTRVGRLAAGVILLLMIMSGGYWYQKNSIDKLKIQERSLKVRYQALQKDIKLYRTQIKNQNALIQKEKKEASKQELIMANIKSSILKLEDMRGKDTTYISFLTKVNALLKRFGLHTMSISLVDKKHMDIEVVSTYENRDKIANFIRALIDQGFLNVTTNEIRLNKKSYISKIGIERE